MLFSTTATCLSCSTFGNSLRIQSTIDVVALLFQNKYNQSNEAIRDALLILHTVQQRSGWSGDFVRNGINKVGFLFFTSQIVF